MLHFFEYIYIHTHRKWYCLKGKKAERKQVTMETVTLGNENDVTKLSKFQYFTFITMPNTTILMWLYAIQTFPAIYLFNKSSIFLENWLWNNQGDTRQDTDQVIAQGTALSPQMTINKLSRSSQSDSKVTKWLGGWPQAYWLSKCSQGIQSLGWAGGSLQSRPISTELYLPQLSAS